MGSSSAKRIRRTVRKQTTRICDEFIEFVKDQKFTARLRFAWRVLFAK